MREGVGVARLSVALVLLAMIAGACGPGGISRDRAIQLALEYAEGPVVVVSAESGPLGRFTDAQTLPSEHADRQVWAVVLSGNFAGECVLNAAGQSVCPPVSARKLVLLDFQSGGLVLTRVQGDLRHQRPPDDGVPGGNRA
jgi:hypothetical protein